MNQNYINVNFSHFLQEDLKGTLQAYDREQSRQQQLERVRERHPSDRHQIAQVQLTEGPTAVL